MDKITNTPREKIANLCQETGIKYLAVFGSRARQEATKDSDLDLLVDFIETPGLIGFIKIKNQLETLFNQKIGLVTKKGLSKHLKPFVQKDLQVIYE